MNNQDLDSIINDVLNLKHEESYKIDDFNTFLDNFNSDLMKKYLKGLIESEPEAQLRATLLNRETPLFKWIFGENILTETHSDESPSKSVDNVADFEGFGRIGIEIKPFFKVEKNEQNNQLIYKKTDLESISNDKKVTKSLRTYLFSTNIAKEYLILTNIDQLYIYSKSSVITQKEDECKPFKKISFNDFLTDYRIIEHLAKYIERKKAEVSKLRLNEIFLRDLMIWVKQISSLSFQNSTTDKQKSEFALGLINRFIFIQFLDAFYVIDRDKINDSWNHFSTYKNKPKEFLVKFLTDIFEFAWDFYDTELFKIGEKGKNSIELFLKKLNQNENNIKKFYNALKYIIGIDGDYLRRGILQYDFRDIDADVLGSTYETFLAYDRKERGIYYTPPFITEFITESAIIDKFNAKVKDLNERLDSDDYEKAFVILNEIYSIKILDPACGSGSFLIRVYDLIWDQYNKIIMILENKFKNTKSSKQTSLDRPYKSPKGEKIDYISILKHLRDLDKKQLSILIAIRHIFGNDFDSSAIEVAKLNLLIHIIKKNTIAYKPEKISNHHVLPYLKLNFSHNNFLINLSHDENINFLLQNHAEQLKIMWEKYLKFLKNPSEIVIIGEISELQDILMNSIWRQFEIKDLFQNSETAPYLPYINHWFLYFDKEGKKIPEDCIGFDIIVGNPPYISLRNLEKEYLNFLLPYLKRFEGHTGYNDTFYYFIEQSLKNLRKDGILSFITTNYFFQDTYARKLREYILDNGSFELLVDFKNFMVFPNQSIHTCMFKIRKGAELEEGKKIKIIKIKYWDSDGSELIKAIKAHYNESEFENQYLLIFSQSQDSLDNISWVFAKTSSRSILDHIEKESIPLENICDITKGTSTGNEIFHIGRNLINEKDIEPELLKKHIRNSDIDRYFINFEDEFLIYILDPTLLNNSPNLKNYLLEHKSELEDRNEVRKGLYDWTRIERPRVKNLYIYESPEKIVTPYRSAYNKFALDNQQYFGGSDVYFLALNKDQNINIQYILGILNSKLMNFYYSFIGKPKGNIKEYFKRPLSKIPIKMINVEDELYKLIIDGVEEITICNYLQSFLFSTFSSLLKSHKFKKKINLKNFCDSGLEYKIDKKKSIISPIYDNEGIVSKIMCLQKDSFLIIKILEKEDTQYKNLTKIWIDDDIIRNYLDISINLFIKNSEKKNWSEHKVKESIEHLEIDQKAKNPASNYTYIVNLINDLKKEVANKIKSNFDKEKFNVFQELNLTKIKEKINQISKQIDSIVYSIYNIDDITKSDIEAEISDDYFT